MKLFKLHPLLLFVLSAVLVTSCGQMKEEIVIEKDGTGSYEMSFDMIPMMRGMMLGMNKMADEGMMGPDSLEMMAKLEEQLWSKFPDEVDSTMDLSQGVPPEVRNDPAKMAVVEKATGFMRGGKNKGYLLSGVNYQFESVDDLKAFYEISREGNKGNPKMDMLMGKTDTEMIITSNRFFRSQKIEQEAEEEEEAQDLSGIEQFFEGAGITTVITVPKKIKKVNVKTYEIVERKGNSVTLKIDILDLFTAKEPAEFDIRW